MTQKDMARGLLGQAKSSLESARHAADDGHWAYAVRTAQDASELALKALLLSAGDEPPRVHDLSHTLEKSRDRLGRLGLSREEIDQMARTADGLARDRSEALYGDERRQIPASRIYGEGDAQSALRAAEGIHERCRGVVEELA